MSEPKTNSDGTKPPMVVEGFQTTTYGMKTENQGAFDAL